MGHRVLALIFNGGCVKPLTFRSFQDLKELAQDKVQARRSEIQRPPPAPDELPDSELFERSMQDVTPLGWSSAPSPPLEPIEIPNPQESEDEGLRLLIEFVEGRMPVDLRLSGEYVEGAPNPKDRVFLEHLRRGHFAVEGHLDLHGLNLPEARDRFEKFIRSSLYKGHGCVRVVHGRGQHSLDGAAVLKEHVQRWLCSRRMGRHVVAYTSARLHDGGGGALYVLLHRRR